MCIRKYQFLPHFHSSSDPDSFFSFSNFLLPSFRIFLLWALLLRSVRVMTLVMIMKEIMMMLMAIMRVMAGMKNKEDDDTDDENNVNDNNNHDSDR